jgi:hypothetical protein
MGSFNCRILGWLLQDDVIDPSLVPVLLSCFKTYQVFFPKHKEWLLELIEQLVSDAQEHCCGDAQIPISSLVIEYPVNSGHTASILDASQAHKGMYLIKLIVT